MTRRLRTREARERFRRGFRRAGWLAESARLAMRGLLRPLADMGRFSPLGLGPARRLVLVQIDGVSRSRIEHAMAEGYMPFLASRLGSGEHVLTSTKSGAPASTPAFQAGLFYGVSPSVPGYIWFDRKTGREVRMDRAEDAAALEARLACLRPGLLRGGSSYFSILSGGAAVAVLARHPITAVRSYDLTVVGREPRGCVRADVEVRGTVVHFFAAHLGLHWRERRRQAAQILSADILRDAALSHPLVLVGDFNSYSNRSAVPRWLRRQLVDCALAASNEAPTFPASFPLLRLDHCYVDGAFAVRSVDVVRTPRARRASDHLPLVVELELLPVARRPPAPRLIEAAGVTTRVGGRPGG